MFRHKGAIIMELYRLVVYHAVGHDTLHTLYHEISSYHVRSRQTSVCIRHTECKQLETSAWCGSLLILQHCNYMLINLEYFFFFPMARQPYMGLGLLVSSRLHDHTL
jgi:hypothetical protein